MMEILVGGFVTFLVLGLGLLFLILLPLILIGAVFKVLLAVLLLPFRLLGAVFGLVGAAAGMLFKGLGAIFGLLLGILAVVLMVVALPLGLLLLFGLAVWGVLKLFTAGAAVGAA